jgi:hypothetical protein
MMYVTEGKPLLLEAQFNPSMDKVCHLKILSPLVWDLFVFEDIFSSNLK